MNKEYCIAATILWIAKLTLCVGVHSSIQSVDDVLRDRRMLQPYIGRVSWGVAAVIRT